MAEIKWTLQAANDLESIAEFISKDSPHSASMFVADLFQATDRISRFPKSGRMVPEVGNPAVREVILGNYRLVYRLKKDSVELLTVFHGSRLFDPSAWKSGGP